jgi:hypothetical protein
MSSGVQKLKKISEPKKLTNIRPLVYYKFFNLDSNSIPYY